MKYSISLLISFVFIITSLNAQVSTTIPVNAGWNLLSVPSQVADSRKGYLFPSASSNAYIYRDAYILKDTLDKGLGFWLKFPTSDSITISGIIILKDSTPVRAGWNIIGSITVPIAVNTIESNPLGMISSQYFGYTPGVGYRSIDTIKPGMGCWVKVTLNGSLFLTSPPQPPLLSSPPKSSINISTPPILTWNPSKGATSYILQVSTDSLFSSLIFNQSGLTDTNQQINGLSYTTKYYWHVKATNNYGELGWSNTWSFSTHNPCSGTPTVYYFGKNYNTIQIGSHCWLKENLDIGIRIEGSQNSSDNGNIEKYCYNNDPVNCTTYGGLYQWHEAMQYSGTAGAQGICPSGWHIPTKSEFLKLAATENNDGNKLKAVGQGTGAGAGTNTSGFSALLTGNRDGDGNFYGSNSYSCFWSSTELNASYANFLYLYYNDNRLVFPNDNKNYGFNVRCIKNNIEPPELSVPSNEVLNVSSSPTLIWHPSSFATSYTLQISTDSLFSSFVYNQSGLTDVSQQVNGLSDGIKYYWHVMGTNGQIYSEWSNRWSFITTLQPPILLSPANETTNVTISPRLVWRTCRGAISYVLQVSNDSLFSSFVYNQSGLADTNQQISGLNNAIRYYWRVSATNVNTTSTWSGKWMFTTVNGTTGTLCQGITTVTYAGKIYNTVQIGNQCWLKENLDVGTMIQGSDTANDNGIIEKYCYNNDLSNCVTYGGLYKWSEAMQYSATEGTQGICPTGWHIATYGDLQILGTTVIGNSNVLKAVGQGTGGGAGTNTSGFSALFSGTRSINGSFVDVGYDAPFWSSTQFGDYFAFYLDILGNDSYIYFYTISKSYGFSIRCLKDSGNTPQTPELHSPSNGSVNISISPTLSWHRSNGATSYTLQVSTDSLFSSYVYNQSGLTDTSHPVSGLNNSTKYYWCVNATNSNGSSSWSSVWWFFTDPGGIINPCPGTPTVSYAGRVYNTVQIGNQCWLKENLNVGNMVDSFQFQTNNSVIEKYCYRDDTDNCNIYGGLYQWNEAMQYHEAPGTKGICPIGWHMPTLSEFQTLRIFVNNDANILKAVGQGAGDGMSTNTSGFSALLSGTHWFVGDDGFFGALREETDIWSSTSEQDTLAHSLPLKAEYSNIDIIYGFPGLKSCGLSVRCLKDEVPQIPELLSPENRATNLSLPPTLIWHPSISAISYIMQVSTDSLFSSFVYNQSGITDTTQQVAGLNYGTKYYWRVSATNIYDTSNWTSTWQFTTGFSCGSTITFIGRTYNTVQVGTQCWFKENLNVGSMIDSLQNQTNNSVIEKYCYHNDTTKCNAYGGLYQWDEAMQFSTSEGAQGICPDGWHIPTHGELQVLGAFVNNNGNELKELGQGTGDGLGNNNSGFSALISTYRYNTGAFGNLGDYAFIWSSSNVNTSLAKDLFIIGSGNGIYFSNSYWQSGFSVRCIKNN